MAGYISSLYYETLIENIPPHLNVLEFFSGSSASAVVTEIGVGVSETVPDTRTPRLYAGATPVRLKTFAGMVRSRNFAEASLGLAAINAYYNNTLPVGIASEGKRTGGTDSLHSLKCDVAGKRAILVGHSEIIEQIFDEDGALTVISNHASVLGGLPLAAAGFVCPDCDVVLADEKCLIRKQLPRLIGCTDYLILAGLGIPAATFFGVDTIRSLLFYTVTDSADTLHLVRKGAAIRDIAKSCSACYMKV